MATTTQQRKRATKKTRPTEKTREHEYLTTEEVADMLRMSVSSVAQWRTNQKSGGPPFIKMGHRVVYDRAALKEWMQARSTQY